MYLDLVKLRKDAEKLKDIESNLQGGADRTKEIIASAKISEVTGVDSFIKSECANELSNIYKDYGEDEKSIAKIIELWLQYLKDAEALDAQMASLTPGPEGQGHLSPSDYNASPSDYNVSPTDYNVSPTDYEYSITDYDYSPSLVSWTNRHSIELVPDKPYQQSYDSSITDTPPTPYTPWTWTEFDTSWTWTEYTSSWTWTNTEDTQDPNPWTLLTWSEEPPFSWTETPVSWRDTLTDIWPTYTWSNTDTYYTWSNTDIWPTYTYTNTRTDFTYTDTWPTATYTNTWITGWSMTYDWPSSYSSIAPWQITPSYDINHPSLVNPDPTSPGGPGSDLDDIIDRLGGTKGGSGSDKDSKSDKNGKRGLSANLSDALKRSSNLLTGGLVPTGGKGSSNSKTGGLLAGGLGLSAAAIAGGLILNSKMKFIYFKPVDFERQDEETQNAIIADLAEAGLTETELLEFKNATFKILTSELTPHVKKAEQAYDNNENFDNEVKEMYGFHLYTEDEKLDKYLLFVAMIIDGANTTDETNIYNIINPSLDEEELDFIYSGINMREYMVTDEDIDEEDDYEGEYDGEFEEEIPVNEETDPEALQALEMLKEMGVDNE